jgi:NadR type nicotinamide-nucleotide adenylyltransferase
MKKIAITGPESTAKSSLAEYLANYYQVPFVPEFAREFMQSKPSGYLCSFDDISFIAKEQMRIEDELSAKNELIFCDTDILVCKVWQEYVFGYCDPFIQNAFLNRTYHLHLLCSVDIPWEFDPLRSNPDDREELFNLYKKELETASKAFEVINGLNDERFNNAIEAVDNILKLNNRN